MTWLLLAAAGCMSGAPQTSQSDAPGAGQSTQNTLPSAMSVEDTKAFVAEHPEALLLDVRNPDEWTGEMPAIEGAMLIPLPELDQRLNEIEDWRSRPIITVCRSGRRSEIARRMLSDAGFENVANMAGGMLAWRRAGY